MDKKLNPGEKALSLTRGLAAGVVVFAAMNFAYPVAAAWLGGSFPHSGRLFAASAVTALAYAVFYAAAAHMEPRPTPNRPVRWLAMVSCGPVAGYSLECLRNWLVDPPLPPEQNVNAMIITFILGCLLGIQTGRFSLAWRLDNLIGQPNKESQPEDNTPYRPFVPPPRRPE